MPFTPYVAMRDPMSTDHYSPCDVRATLLLTTAYYPTDGGDAGVRYPTDGGDAGVRDGRLRIPPDTTFRKVPPSCT